jgi:hypothetical protein
MQLDAFIHVFEAEFDYKEYSNNNSLEELCYAY